MEPKIIPHGPVPDMVTPQGPLPEMTTAGAAASYYHSTSPVPVPGATVLTPGSGLPPGFPPTTTTTAAPAPGPGPSPAASAAPVDPVQQQTTWATQTQTFDPPPLVHTSPILVQTTAELTQSPGPVVLQKSDLARSRSGAEFALREYASLQRRRYASTGSLVGEDLEVRIKSQAELVARDLGRLRTDVIELARAAEGHRWRRWLLGGIIGSFIPAVRAIFRRGEADRATASNDTEYAFYRSRSLVGRILDSVQGSLGRLASFTFFVFAVLYVFQNEVEMRVAKTVGKRLRRLCAKVESLQDISERDMALLAGWRWRVLTWS